MSTYRAPLREMQFVLRELAGVDAIAKLPGFEETPDVLDAILEEASTFATEVLDPINRTGDVEGCTWNDGAVTTPAGFKEAYRQFAQAEWIGLPVSTEHGGQGLPHLMLGPTLKMWNAANVGFANGPLLNRGAIEAIGGWQMARAAQISATKIAAGTRDPFYAAKLATARFYADHVLNQALALHHEIVHGSASVMTLTEEQFDLDRQILVVA